MLSTLSQLQNRLAKAGVKRMTKWCGLVGVIMIAASIAAARAATDQPHQSLDIPWERLDLASQRRLREVTEKAVFFRDVLGITIRSRQPVFDFLIEHPDFAATAGRILGTVQHRIVKEREGVFSGDDARGATGTFELMYARPGKRIYLAKGTFVKRLLPTIHGRIVLVIVYEHLTDQTGGSRVINHVRGYLRIDNATLGVLAYIASPIVGPIVDKKILRTFGAAAQLMGQAYDNPASLYHTLASSPEIAKSDLREFRKILRCCAEDAGQSRSLTLLRANE
jgi:hypothetical protein